MNTEQTTAETGRTSRPLLEGRLLVFAAIIVSAFTLRLAVTAFTPLAERIGGQIGYSTAVVGVFGMIPTAMFAAAGVLTPILVRRLGDGKPAELAESTGRVNLGDGERAELAEPAGWVSSGLERTALVAMLAAGAGQAVRAFVPQTWELLLCSALALAGMGIGNVVIPPLVKRYFPDRLALVSALYITMVQAGTVLPALVAVPVADAHGWRVSLGMWAVVAFAAALPWLGVLRDRRGRDVLDRTALPAAHEPGSGRAWRSPVAWGMAGMFGMTSLTTYSMFTWMPKIFSDAGASPGFGGTMVGIFALIGLGAALVAPSITARVRNPFPIVVGCAVCFAGAFAGLLWAPMSAPLLWVVLLGLGPSTFPMALTLINLRSRTQAGSAALSGFAQGVGYLAACAGPLLFGVLHTTTGGWGAPFALLSVAVAVMLAGAWMACKPRMLEDSWG